MKKILFSILIMAGLAGFLVVSDVQAGWFDKQKEEEAKTKTHRFDYYPSMDFHLGTLRRDSFSGWKLDETRLHFIDGIQITSAGNPVDRLDEGSKVLVMGARVGDTMVVWRMRVLEPEWNISRDTSRDHEIIWSTSDPTVGEGPAGE